MEIILHKNIDLSQRHKEELNKAVQDLANSKCSFDYTTPDLILTDTMGAIPGCGLYRYPNSIYIIPDECAKRNYSDYRWRVNRTLHGVIIHEYGHHFERMLYDEDILTESNIKNIFKPKNDITNYSDVNYKENFAESFRVYITNPELLKAINKEKYNFFQKLIKTENDGKLEQWIETFTGTIRYQLETTNTNKHIRTYMKENNIDYKR